MADQEEEAGGPALHVGVRELHELDGVTPDRHGRVRQEDVLRGLLVVEVLRSGDVEHLDREAARVEVGVSLLPADAVREPRDDALRRTVVGEDAEAGPRVAGVIEAELAVQACMGLRVEAALDRLVVLGRGLPLDRLDLLSERGELPALLGLAAEEVLRVHRRDVGGRDLRRERLGVGIDGGHRERARRQQLRRARGHQRGQCGQPTRRARSRDHRDHDGISTRQTSVVPVRLDLEGLLEAEKPGVESRSRPSRRARPAASGSR